MPMLKRWNILLLTLMMMCAGLPALAQTSRSGTVYSPEALQQDLRFLREEIDRIHPDPGLFVSRETLRKAYAAVEAQLQQGMDQDQAWRVFATLNPVFADGHLFVVYPDWQALTRAHLAGGGALFPYEVQVGAGGDITIRTELGKDAPSALAGTRIEQINGVPAARIVRELLARTGGDTAALRANVLSRRMWFAYWKMFGAPEEFDLALAKPTGLVHLKLAASKALPTSVTADGTNQADGFGKTFRFELLPDGAALLTINHFLWPDKQAFYAFTRDAFSKIRAARVKTLIIDVRDNPGGDDDMWKTGVLSYIADKPFRNASSYVKKVIAGRASGSEKVGDVVHGFGDTWVEPDLGNPLHFSGRTYVLVGRMTYSSAVLFSNVVQDFGFGRLVGAGGYARTRQTGGVVPNILLPNTGLQITIPRFVVDRPSGEREPALVRPDIVLPDSPLDRRAIVDALLVHDRKTRAAGADPGADLGADPGAVPGKAAGT